ncbi:Inner membrane lipoprotein YiaD precursor [Anaerohalosphaera lusitana]|uniref:Inner membrane lipoprotein YiaD n=1 Tax=Anaerohalosphaera lusitana TaxID=1936003 RepID=A0A1U9NHI0_9BACT|nr:OmpA family protein [Anaerohalosphaera lusitana]AQT67204.1 Inner membrane lipoprotein YiaD precursor [Anaerohalosphaera lusitana]
MKSCRIVMLLVVAGLLVAGSGCVSQEEYQSLKDQNRIQQETITSLESQVRNAELQVDQMEKQLEALRARMGADTEAQAEEIAALEADIAAKKQLIEQLRAEMLRGGVKLPMGLSLKLRDFAESNDMVDFDEERGVLKFKSDFLFAPGSAQVQQQAMESINLLSDIMTSGDGEEFDVIVAGHTDSDPIKYSKAKHPTNWHLSAHRGIGVLQKMVGAGVDPERLSVRGFGEYRPVASNETKEGKAQNRRVEIYIVPQGQ